LQKTSDNSKDREKATWRCEFLF